MPWIVEGNADGLILGVNRYGLFTIMGTASRQKLSAEGCHVDATVQRSFAVAKCAWSIHTNTENEMHLDRFDTGFYEKVTQFPDRSVASVCFLEGSDRVSMTIAMPHQVFDRAFQLFQQVLTTTYIGYVLDIGFSGFREPDSVTDNPSVEEFLAGPMEGRPYISEEVSLRVRRAVD